MKKKLTLKNGTVISFEPTEYRETHLGKVRLSRNGEDVEGIWVSLSDKAKLKYDNDESYDEYFVAMLANDALNFYPMRSWGLHVVCKTQGDERPICDLEWVDYEKESNQVRTNEKE